MYVLLLSILKALQKYKQLVKRNRDCLGACALMSGSSSRYFTSVVGGLIDLYAAVPFFRNGYN